MIKLKSFLLASLVTGLSMVSQAQRTVQESNQTLILTLQYQQNQFEILNARVLNEKLAPRFTAISDVEDLSYAANRSTPSAYQASNIDPDVLHELLVKLNSSEKYEQYRLAGKTLIMRYPYGANEVTFIPQVRQASNTKVKIKTEVKAKPKPDSLPDQLELSPGVKHTSNKAIYSDLI